MKHKLSVICLCLSLMLCCCACVEESPQPSFEPILELPEGAPEDAEVHTAEDGVKVINPAASEATENLPKQAASVTPDTVWLDDPSPTYHSYTPPDKAALDAADCIGILSIPSIGLEVKAIDPGAADMLSVMDRGAAHFVVSSSWDGNVALSAHNATADGSPAYFQDLHLLETGSEVYYTTALGERRYLVSEMKEISDADWEYVLERPEENWLTLITCISGKADKRLMVRAVEAAE